MYTVERSLPLFDVNECLIALAQALEPLRGDGSDDLRQIYDYRTSPQKTASASITSIDELPYTTVFTGVHYDYMIDIVIPHDGTPESLRNAEHRLNRLCRRAWEVLMAAESETWADLVPARNNMKPGSPPENPYVRRALIFVRLVPN